MLVISQWISSASSRCAPQISPALTKPNQQFLSPVQCLTRVRSRQTKSLTMILWATRCRDVADLNSLRESAQNHSIEHLLASPVLFCYCTRQFLIWNWTVSFCQPPPSTFTRLTTVSSYLSSRLLSIWAAFNSPSWIVITSNGLNLPSCNGFDRDKTNWP